MASQTLDETVMTLLSMGFEFQDAQDAIQYGKITVQDAVEWILAGKPGYAPGGSAPPTLKLTEGQNTGMPNLRPDTGAPFVSPMPISNSNAASASSNGASAQLPTSPPSAATAAPSSSDIDMEQQVVSRLHLSDVKLAEKKHFEEKVRAELEKKMKLEKMQAKRERDRVLKEIAEDRKMSKIMKTQNPPKPSSEPSDVPKAAPKTSSSEASSSVSSGVAQCSIQIRLPSGKQLRKKLDSATTLGQLWLTVLQEAETETEGYSGFMQPFPRREFSASEMNKTLEQLGLVPSGSLVLKKKDTAAEPEREAETVQEPASEAEPMEEPRHPYGEWMPVRNHQWGPGRSLEGQEPAEEEEGREAQAEEGNGEMPREMENWGRGRRLEDPEDDDEDMNGGEDDNGDDDDDDDMMAGLNPGGAQGGAVNPILQGFLGQNFGGYGGGGFGGWNQRDAFIGVGQRLIPEGVPGADNHIYRPMGDLAAEAAQQRLAQPAPVVEVNPVRQTTSTVQVQRLEDLSMAAVIDRIACQASTVHSLGRLPESLSEKILQCLLQKHLLDGKTLRLFCSCCLRKLVLDTYNYATNDLLYAARLHPTLQVLSLHSCPLISDKGIEHVADLKNLKVLNLGLCKQMTNKCLKAIAGFRKLQTLSLEETGVTESGLVEYLATKPCLRNLNLNRTAVTNAIFQHLKNLEHLETLCLEETKISSLEGVRDLKKLSSLNLASTLITADTLCHLVDHPALSHLNLSSTENLVGDTALLYLAGLKLKTLCLPDRHTVTSAGLAHIAGFPLHTLDLTNYIHVGDEGMEYVGQITSLGTLMLSNTKVTDAGLQQLSSLTRLTILHLDRTTVSDAGVAIVRAFKELTELSLSATNVTNRFLKQGVLHSCQGLTKLNLSRTHVGDKGLEKLTLPYLSMLNLDCTGVHARVVDTIRTNCPSLKSVTTANLTPVLEEMEEEEED